MPLPKPADQIVRKQIDSLLEEIASLEQIVEQSGKGQGRLGPPAELIRAKLPLQGNIFDVMRARFINLLTFLYQSHPVFGHQIEDIRLLEATVKDGNALIGAIKAFKADYEAGVLDALADVIEADIISDYMGQAEQLLGEGIPGQHDYVPAAVLAGAVLEDTLRRLCQRQSPPIDTLKPNGDKKTLDPLITDLQKANVFNKAKADQLKSWAKTRNYAAHGEFTEFNRTEVEAMIVGVKAFIADYM